MANPGVLLVFPHNPFALRSGVHKRFYELIRYFNSRGFPVDLLGLLHFESNWDDFSSHPDSCLITNLFLFDHRKGLISEPGRYGHYFPDLVRRVTGKPVIRSKELPDYAFGGLRKYFRSILSKGNYRYIVISYVYWANLIDGLDCGPARKILMIEDFITQTHFDSKKGMIDPGRYFREEIRRIDLFDHVICISDEERLLFSKFTRKPVYSHIPAFMDEQPCEESEKAYDTLFIGYDNYSNRNGLDWFFREVVPLLDPSLRLAFAGNIVTSVPDRPNLIRLGYVRDLREIYSKSRLTINPLIDGTGMKVKVVESLSYGVPVVSTLRGLTGIPRHLLERFLVAASADEFAAYIHKLVKDQEFYKEQVMKSQGIFRDIFSKDKVYKELDKIFLQF